MWGLLTHPDSDMTCDVKQNQDMALQRQHVSTTKEMAIDFHHRPSSSAYLGAFRLVNLTAEVPDHLGVGDR